MFCFCYSLRYFLLLHRKVTHQKGLLSSMYRPDEFLNRRAKGLDIQASPEPGLSWRAFWQPHPICTPPHSRHIYSTTFARLKCSHSNAIWATFMLPLSTAPTQSHPRFVILTALHSCSRFRKTLCERSRRTHEIESWWGSALRFESVSVTYAKLCTCRRLQLNKMPGHNVLCGAARSAKLLQHSELSPFVPNFSLVPSRRRLTRGKIQYVPKKNHTERKNRFQVPDQAGPERAGPRWGRAGMRAGVGPGRGGRGDVRVPA